LLASKFFEALNKGKYDPDRYYGQAMPDASWIKRNDQRGLCIPPYFVFQFQADGRGQSPEIFGGDMARELSGVAWVGQA